jgi:hypothetical protein
VLRRDEPWFRLAPHLAPPSATIDDAQDLEQRRALGFPAIRKKEGEVPHTGNDLGHQRGSVLLRARADVNPEEKPTAHRQRRMNPEHLAGAEFGMGFIQLHAWHVYLAYALALVGLSPLGRHPLEARDRREIDSTDVRGPRITNAPALTLQQSYGRVCGALTPG